MTASKVVRPPEGPTPGDPTPGGNPLKDLWDKLPDVVRQIPAPILGGIAVALPIVVIAAVVLQNINQVTSTEPRTERWVDLSGSLVIVSEPRPGPNDPGRCVSAIFLVFPDVPGATQYRGNVNGEPPSHDVAVFGPPFPHDEPYYVRIAADEGTHRVFVAGGSSGKGCGSAADHAANFSIESLQVYTKRPSISGRVVDLDARPIAGQKVAVYQVSNVTDAPCAADPRPEPLGVGTTNGDGKYEVYVDEGEFEVCPTTDAPFLPEHAEVSTEFIESPIANFVIEGRRLSGTVVDGEGLPLDGASISAIPVDEGDPPGAATTGADGTYETWLAPGSYKVSAQLDRTLGTPGSVTADLSDDDATVDFAIVQAPILAEIDEPTAVGPGAFVFTATVTDDSGTDLTFEWDFGDEGTSTEIAPVHDYAKPGPYVVSLVVSNANGVRSDPATLDLEILAPELTVELRGVDGTDPVMDVGESVPVELEIAAGEGLGPLDLAFEGATITTPGGVTVDLAAAEPAIPAAIHLEPGTRQVYTVPVTGVAEGPFTIASKLVGTDAAARDVTASAERTGQVGVILDVELDIRPAPNPDDSTPPGPDDPKAFALTFRSTQDENGDGLPDLYGFEPRRYEITVKVTNRTQFTVEGVQLVGVTSGLQLGMADHEKRAPAPFPIEVTQAPDDLLLGDMAAGAVEERTFVITASEGGEFEISTVAHGALPTGPVDRIGVAPLTLTTDVVAVLEVLVRPTPQPGPRIDEGQSYTIGGRVHNLTTDEVVSVGNVRIGLSGNGTLIGPIDSSLPGLIQQLQSYWTASANSCPVWSYSPDVGPGEHSDFTAIVGSRPIPLPPELASRQQSVTSYAIRISIPGEDGKPVQVDPSKVRIFYGHGSWVDPATQDTKLRVEVVPKLPRPTSLPYDTAAFVVLLKFNANVVEQVWPWLKQQPANLVDLATLGATGLIKTEQFILQTVNAQVYISNLRWELRNLPAEEREKILTETALAEYPIYGAAKDFVQFRTAVDAAIEAQFTRMDAWLERVDGAATAGDMYELVDLAAEPGSALAPAAFDLLVGDAVFNFQCRMLGRGSQILADVAKAQGEARAAAAAARIEAAIAAQQRFGQPGAVGVAPEAKAILEGGEEATKASARALSGMDAVTFENSLRVTDWRNGGLPIVLAFRSRIDECIAWFEQGARLKPYGMNPKTVDEWDVVIGGYRKGPPGNGKGDIGSVVLSEPPPWDEVQRRFADLGLSPIERTFAEARWRTRWKEWYGVKPPRDVPAGWAVKASGDGSKSTIQKLKEMAPNRRVEPDGTVVLSGEFPVPKDGQIHAGGNRDTQAAVDQALLESEKRMARFELRRPPDADAFAEGREYWEVWIDGNRVTGDQDLVVASHLNGELLSPELAAQGARATAELTGTQHWASSSAPAFREQYILDHIWSASPEFRGEPLTIFANGKAYHGYIRRWFALNEPAQFVNLEGVPLFFDRVDFPPAADIPMLEMPVPGKQGYIDPVSSMVLAPGIDAGPGAPALHDVTLGRDPGSPILRRGADGGVEAWSEGTGWRPTDHVANLAPGAPLHLALQTGLSSAAAAGTQRLEVIAAEDILGAAGADGSRWFESGDRIVINPGGTTEEIATVVGLGSLRLETPTKYDHAIGEVVSLIPAGGALPIIPIVVGLFALLLVAAAGALVLARRRSRTVA